MNKKVILSIYTATYNRREVIEEKVKDLLNMKSSKFNIWVLDDCSDDGTFEALNRIKDRRLHVLQNETRQGNLKDGVMQNWYRLLESCDGQFSFHLNDRDFVDNGGIERLITFLEQNRTLSGGICTGYYGAKIYQSPKNSFLKIPYRGSHPTGIVFNMEMYRKILDRKSLFTKEKSYIHPHDLILGELSEQGRMFLFDKIWWLAGRASFANNKSFLYKKGSFKTAWFSPDERIKEFEMMIDALDQLRFKREIKKKKCKKIAKSYMYFCTFNYAYYISDPGQTQHYGIEPQNLTRKELVCEKNKFIKRSADILARNTLIGNRSGYRLEMTIYFWSVYFGKPFWELFKKGIHRKW